MKKRLLLKLMLSFALLIGSSIAKAQDMINPLNIPKPSSTMPPWAKLLYVKPLNVNDVTAAFDEYYRNHPLPVEGKGHKEARDEEYEHEKIYVLYYYRLKMFTRNAVKEDGTLKTSQEMENDQLLSEDVDETKSDIWSPLNAETYWPANDDTNNAMVDEQANVYCFDVFPDNTNIAYAGTETGGLYKTTDNGQLWKQISKNYSFEELSAIAIKPNDADVVFVGDNKAIYKTSDGGEKWKAVKEIEGLSNINEIGVNAIEISPLNPTVILVATNKGIIRSADGGESWKRVKSPASTDIAINPKDANVVYAVLQKKDSTFYECWKSVDQGKTFKRKRKEWPTKYTGGKAVIGLTAADTSTIYIAMLTGPEDSTSETPILVKSTNGGDNWKTVAVGNKKEESSAFPLDGGQGWYDFIILVSPINENHVIIGTTESYKSTDGGIKFKCLSDCDEAPLRIHADLQAAKAIEKESWIASDGGMTYSTDFFTKESISRVKGLNGSEWWGMAAGWNRDIIVGGLYHNGDVAYSEMYDNKTLRVGGGESATGYMNPFFDRNTYFSDIEDFGQQLPTSITEEIAEIPQLSMFPNELNEEMGSGEIEWDPRYASVFYLGKDNVFYKTTNNGAEFKPLHTFKEGTEILQFEISRSNPKVIYVVERNNIRDKEDGKIWKTTDGGINWFEITTIPNTSKKERNYMAITMSATDEDEVWVALKDGSKENKVFKTIDGGLSWLNLTTPRIKNLKVASIMHQLGTNGGVYVGGSNGKIYYKNNQLSDWKTFSKGLPVNYSASFLKPFYRDNKIRTGGIGGLWEATLYENSALIAQPMVDKESGTSCPADTFYFDSYSVLPAGATFFWSFPGAAYVSSPTIRNPKVVYTPGKHSVTLTVSNGDRTDTKTINDLVTVTTTANTPPMPRITPSGNTLVSSSTTGNQWYLDGQPLPGATGKIYTANQNGNYTVIVTKNRCVSTASKPIKIERVRTEEIVNPNQLNVYPNPSNGHFTVEFSSSNPSAYTLQIENVIGQVIYKEEIKNFKGSFTKLLNIGEGMSGVYTLRLSNGQSSTVRKVIVH